MKVKLTILLCLSIVVLLLAGAFTREARQLSFNKGYQPTQPIAFSHKIHAGDNDIQCMYCHFGADKGRHAAIPPTQLCMNCHTQIKKDSTEIAKIKEAIESGKPIEWIKVNHYPDYAYFNHSQHVAVGKVSCVECHGEIGRMARVQQVKELNMGWCLECHRSKGIAPPNDHKSMAGGDCARCHY